MKRNLKNYLEYIIFTILFMLIMYMLYKIMFYDCTIKQQEEELSVVQQQQTVMVVEEKSESVVLYDSETEEVKEIVTPPTIALGYEYIDNIPLDYELQDTLHIVCDEFKVDYRLVLGLIEHESSFNIQAVNKNSGCYGLMQLNPKYFPKDLDAHGNIIYGVEYLAQCINRYDGNISAGLRAYNRGYDDGKKGYSNIVLKYARDNYGYEG